MTTCTNCGNDVTGKKFCPECGTPVQSQAASDNAESMTTCPRCNGAVRAGSAFCMHCGSALSAQNTVVTANSSQAVTHTCPACHTEVPAGNTFCTNCGQNLQVTTPSNFLICTNCGLQNNSGVNYCARCGKQLGVPGATPNVQPGQYPQQQQYAPQYGQQYNQYPQQQYSGQFGQAGYQLDPMIGQQQMVLRCPVCMAMSPLGTPNCPSCRTSLAGVVPTPEYMPAQSQQGGFGGLMQGNGGKYAMGALGGAAAVIGGEMLLHEIEGGGRRRYDYEDRRDDDGPLGGLGNIANDIGLF